MRIKKLLEQEIDKATEVQRLNRFVEQGDYYIPDVKLYRGKSDEINKILEKTTVSDIQRSPRDTEVWLDFLIDRIFTDCFPEYPRRRNSRFATVVKQSARSYGKYLYVIIPHKDAKLLSTKEDPLDVFHDITRLIETIGEDGLEKIKKNVEKEIKEIVGLILGAFRGDIKTGVIKKHGCLDGIIKKLYDSKYESMDFRKLKAAFQALRSYFNSLKLGDPNLRSGGEVMFQGEYLQVPINIFEEYEKEFIYT